MNTFTRFAHGARPAAGSLPVDRGSDCQSQAVVIPDPDRFSAQDIAISFFPVVPGDLTPSKPTLLDPGASHTPQGR